MLIKKFLKKCQKIRNLIYQYYYKIYQKNKLSGYIVKKDFTKLDPIKE